MIEAYFVSDIHLKSMEERNGQTLLRFLRSLRRPSFVTHLFLVGDIFDLWISSHHYFIEKFHPLIEEIRSLVEQGVEVHFFEGNHDLYLRDFWAGELGVMIHPDVAHFTLDKMVVRVEHGDLMNPDDRGYLLLRSFLRTSGMTWLAKNLPGSLVRKIGERASSASRQYTSTAKKLDLEKVRAIIRTHAQNAFAEKPFDIIVSGHVHVRDEFEFEASGKTVRSVNLGSWFDKPKAFKITSTGSSFIDL